MGGSVRTWRASAVILLVVVLAATAIPAAAGATTPGHQQAHYCKKVDAYRLKTCAKALLPDSPLGRQLRWVLAQMAGDAATLTEAEVRAHFSAEFLTVVMPPEEVIGAFQGGSPRSGPYGLLALPTRHGLARRRRWSRAPRGCGGRWRSASPAAARP